MRGTLDFVMELENDRREARRTRRFAARQPRGHEHDRRSALRRSGELRRVRGRRIGEAPGRRLAPGSGSAGAARPAARVARAALRAPGPRGLAPGAPARIPRAPGRRSAPTAPTVAGCARRSACFVAENTAFLHGGISPALAGTSLEEIDRRVHEDLARFDADKQRFVAEGLILPFDDLGETTRAVREELEALSAAGAAAHAAAERAGKTVHAARRGRRAARGLRALSRLGELDDECPRRAPLVPGLQRVERRRGRGRDAEAPDGRRRRALRRRAHGSEAGAHPSHVSTAPSS